MQDSQDIQPFRITKIWAKNFRSLADVSVELDRMTVLVGSNASGKSSVLDILRFIKDALRFDLEAAISQRGGIEAIQRRNAEGLLTDIEVGLECRGELAAEFSPASPTHYSFIAEYNFTIASEPDGGFHVKEEHAKMWRDRIREGHDREWQDVKEEPLEFRVEGNNLKIAIAGQLDPIDENLKVSGRPDPIDLELRTIPNILSLMIKRVEREERAQHRLLLHLSDCLDHFVKALRDSRFYHIFPNTIREPQKLLNSYLMDEDAGNLASVLRAMEKEESGGMPRLKDSLQILIPGVTDLEVTAAGGYLVIRLKHNALRGHAWFDLTQESDGTVRLLGLLTALYQWDRHPLIGIEEPELTIHPGALVKLADVMNEVSRVSQVLVTTHSSDLVDYLTDYRKIDCLRIVELREGVTVVRRVTDTQVEAVKRHLFSPGELHRLGKLK